MKKNNKKILAIIMLLLVALGIYFIFNNISIEKTKNNYQDYTPQEEISDEQLRQTKVILFFANAETGELETEIKIIDANKLVKNPYKELIELLINGPQNNNLKKLIPDGTIVHDVTLQNSCAIINFSNEILNYENEENKFKIINSIVNTMSNLKEVQSVKFLINGGENSEFLDNYTKSI